MTSLPAAELIKRIDGRKNARVEGSQALIKDLGDYFNGVIPSTVNDNLIVRTEAMLNNLRRNFDEQSYRQSLKESIELALSTASALSYDIQRKKRSDKFFERVPRLGVRLLALRSAIDIARK